MLRRLIFLELHLLAPGGLGHEDGSARFVRFDRGVPPGQGHGHLGAGPEQAAITTAWDASENVACPTERRGHARRSKLGSRLTSGRHGRLTPPPS